MQTGGKSIRISLVDGDASGLLTSKVMNWSGKLLVSPRTKLAELPEMKNGICVIEGWVRKCDREETG